MPSTRLAALALAGLLVTTGCSAFEDDTTTTAREGSAAAPAADDDGGGVTAVAAFYPLQYVTERVGGDLVTVENLTTPGTEPHDLELTIRETATITEADLLVFESGFQPAVDESVEQNATGTVVDAADAADLVTFEENGAAAHDHEDHADEDHADEDHADEHDHEHDHEGEAGHSHDEEHADEHAEEEHAEDDHGHSHDPDALDPHFWLDPARVADVGDAVADALGEVDPDNAETYATNAADLRADLESLDGELTDGLAGCERDTIVVSHDAFGYLSKYGVSVAPVAGLSPDAEPTPAVLGALQELIREDGITTVFSERLASPRFTDALAADTGATTAVLDPIEGLTDETSGEDYLSLMEQNLAALRTANGCG